VAVKVVDAGSSVIPTRVVIRLVVGGLVPVVDAVERKFQITAIFVEFEAIEVTVTSAEGVLAVKELNATGILRRTRSGAGLLEVHRIRSTIKHKRTRAASEKLQKFTFFYKIDSKSLPLVMPVKVVSVVFVF